MFMSITTDRTPRPNSLGDLGITSGSNSIVSLSEFTYKKGIEIYGEKEPAEYVYQVKKGVVRSYKLLSDGRRQIGEWCEVTNCSPMVGVRSARFTWSAIFLGWRTVRRIDLRRKPSCRPLFA